MVLLPRPETLARALKGVQLDAGVTFDFNLSPATREAVQHFVALVKTRKLAPASVDHARKPESYRRTCRHRRQPRGRGARLSRYFAGRCAILPRKAFADPSWWRTDASFTTPAARKRRNSLSRSPAAVDCLRALEAGGIALDAARGMIYFRLAADADEFLTIAKFRAVRKLWARVEEACGLTPKPATVAAETAWRMMTRRDPYVNMLRTTIAVAAAGPWRRRQYRGAAAHRGDWPARRACAPRRAQHATHSSRRIQSGQGFRSCRRLRRIEDLTNKLCAAAWTQFQEIDKAGGAWARSNAA